MVLRLLAATLRPLSARFADLARRSLARYGGDLATLGKGELFAPHP